MAGGGRWNRWDGWERWPRYISAAERRARAARELEKRRKKGLIVSPVVVEGAGAEELVRYANAHPNTVISMCTHGRSGVKRWLLGSVTEKFVFHSDDPVQGDSASESQRVVRHHQSLKAAITAVVM